MVASYDYSEKDPVHRAHYQAAVPIQDRSTHPSLVSAGSYPRLTGIDGRYMGSFRRFPGFKQAVDIRDVAVLHHEHGVGTLQTDSNTKVDDITEVYFFKYISVQVVAGLYSWNDEPMPNAVSGRVFRGFVVAHDYEDGTDSNTRRGMVRFVYYDTEESAWRSIVLLQEYKGGTLDARYHIDTAHENFEGDGAVITADSEYDVAAMGPFIYLTVSRGSPAGKPGIQSYDGTIPRDYYTRSVRFQQIAASTLSVQTFYTEFGPLQNPFFYEGHPVAIESAGAGHLHEGYTVRTGMRLFSSYKNVSGPLLQSGDVEGIDSGNDGKVQWTRDGSVDDTSDDTDTGRGFVDVADMGVDDDYLGPWIRVYRTIDSYWFENEGLDAGTILGGTMFREEDRRVYDRTISASGAGYSASYKGTDSNPYGFYDMQAGRLPDAALVCGARFDPRDTDTAFAPYHLRLLFPYSQTLLRVGSMPRANEPAVTIDREEILSWGALTKYAPEECRVANCTPLGSGQDERILALAAAGDAAFAIGDSAVFRIRRNGNWLTIAEVESSAGGVGRYAALGVGSALYYISPSGGYIIDSASNEIQFISALSRIILEDWRGTLSSIRMAYDSRLGALCILNDTQDEMLLLWSNNGLITTLRDVPFRWATQGVNPADRGHARSFWINSLGVIYTPNADRDTDEAQTMCGGNRTSGSVEYKWNGTQQRALSAYNVTLDSVELNTQFPIGIVGFKVYVLSGNCAGESRVIAERTDSWTLAVSEAFSEALAVGDRFAIAPVVFEVVGWPFQDTDIGHDLFQRKVVASMAHDIKMLAGDTSGVNCFIEHAVYTRGDINLGDEVLVKEIPMSADPTFNYSDVRAGGGGSTIHPAWRQFASDLDFEWLSGLGLGMLYEGGGESLPSG